MIKYSRMKAVRLRRAKHQKKILLIVLREETLRIALREYLIGLILSDWAET